MRGTTKHTILSTCTVSNETATSASASYPRPMSMRTRRHFRSILSKRQIEKQRHRLTSRENSFENVCKLDRFPLKNIFQIITINMP